MVREELVRLIVAPNPYINHQPVALTALWFAVEAAGLVAPTKFCDDPIVALAVVAAAVVVVAVVVVVAAAVVVAVVVAAAAVVAEAVVVAVAVAAAVA